MRNEVMVLFLEDNLLRWSTDEGRPLEFGVQTQDSNLPGVAGIESIFFDHADRAPNPR